MLGNPAEKKNLAWSPTQIPYRAQGCMSFKGELTQQQQNMSPPPFKIHTLSKHAAWAGSKEGGLLESGSPIFHKKSKP